MDKKFKSSIGALIRNFLVNLFILLFILLAVYFCAGLLLLNLDRSVLWNLPLILTVVLIAIVITSLWVIGHNNVTVYVVDGGVDLYRNKKIFQRLKKEKYLFTSFVSRSFSQIGIYTSRYLRTIDRKSGKTKDYRLLFSKKNFNNLLEAVDALNNEANEESNTSDD